MVWPTLADREFDALAVSNEALPALGLAEQQRDIILAHAGPDRKAKRVENVLTKRPGQRWEVERHGAKLSRSARQTEKVGEGAGSLANPRVPHVFPVFQGCHLGRQAGWPPRNRVSVSAPNSW